jgi:elongation factor Ts
MLLEQIKKLREETGVSVMLCKKALEETGGDREKAILILRREGVRIAEKKAERALKAGVIESYIHSNRQIGVLVEARSETDFVARNKEFQAFVHNIAMHIAASDPVDLKALLQQPYIKNPQITIGDYLKETIQKFGENLEISRFVRYNI